MAIRITSKKVAKVFGFAVFVLLSVFIVLALIGTGIAKLAFQIGEVSGGGPQPVWWNADRIVAAIGSAIGALTGGVVAIVAIEWQGFRQKSDMRSTVRLLLDEGDEAAKCAIDEETDDRAAAREHAASAGAAWAAAMWIAGEGAKSDPRLARLYAKMRPRAGDFDVMTGESHEKVGTHEVLAKVETIRGKIEDWKGILEQPHAATPVG